MHTPSRVTSAAPEANDGTEIVVRPAERADLLAVVGIENESFPQPWPYEAFERFLGEPTFLVAVDGNDRVAGYVVSDVTPNYGRDIGHVKDFAVHPTRRGVGIGSTLLSRAIAVLAVGGARTVKLEVRESNHAARRLYREFGFDPLRRIPRYYEDGENALVMIRELE